MDSYLIYYGFTAIAVMISGAAQAFIMYTYNSNSKINNNRGIKGKEAARMILDKHGLNSVLVTEVNGMLSDHYDPRKKTVRLSNSNYMENTISAVAVACHECGHAIQDKENYLFMKIRAALVPIVNICSYTGYISIFLGVILGALNFIWIGIILECAMLLFQLVTLPVEFDASRRALKEIKQNNILDSSEHKKAKRVLMAAALTYVASVLTTLLQIARLLLMFTRRRD